MPITLKPWTRPVDQYPDPYNTEPKGDDEKGFRSSPVKGNFAASARDVLMGVSKIQPSQQLLQSSYRDLSNTQVLPRRNGFVTAAMEAYSRHHHLTFRPDDVWFTVLSQFSCYVNANAEALREKFVAHEGQKEIKLVYDASSRFGFDFSVFALDMNRALEEHIVDPTLRDWILPKFSTTDRDDTVVASIMMMGTLQAYFRYTCGMRCGIPSVTLLGEKADWELLLTRLDKLEKFGPEPTQFAKNLRPIIKRFIRSFTEPHSPDIVDFWKRIADHTSGSGMNYWTGWITAFCFWNGDGKQMYSDKRCQMQLDDVGYCALDSSLISPGWVKVPVLIDDNGTEIQSEMVAGCAGIECSANRRGEMMENGSIGVDSMQPSSGWWLYEKPAETG